MGFWDFLNPNKSRFCKLCQRPAKDRMTDEFNDKNQAFYCREHLIDVFKQKFCSYPYSIIVCHPRTDRYYNSMYPFYPLTEFKKYNFSENDKSAVEKLITPIALNECVICHKHASVRYFPTTDFKGGAPAASSLFLCKEDAFEKIKETLENNHHDYDEWGIIPPFGGEGIFVNTAL